MGIILEGRLAVWKSRYSIWGLIVLPHLVVRAVKTTEVIEDFWEEMLGIQQGIRGAKAERHKHESVN